MVFMIAAGANILASLLAIAVLKPWRKTVVANAQASYPIPRDLRSAATARSSQGMSAFFRAR
jgi:MFS transporter, OFA family, oxalate/formate antiporter